MAPQIRFYTTESLGVNSKRAWTPEKFLLCSSVPIARVGTLLYGAGEIPVQANRDGVIRITRDESEVFHPNAILSFAAKPVTDEHPPSKVTPDNWKEYTVGTVLNPRRGDGLTENNLILYADLLIQDRQAILDVLSGKIEVSAGYDAEYEALGPGEGKQHNIIGNHVALVDRGRCGPICSIGDRATMAKSSVARKSPAARRAQSFHDKMMAAFLTGDEESFVQELDEVSEMMGSTGEGSGVGNVGFSKGTTDEMGGTHVHIHTGAAPAQDDDPPVPAAGGAAPPVVPPTATTPPPAEGGGLTLEALAARIDQLEQAIAILAQGEEGEEGQPPDENSPGQSSTPPDNNDRAMVGDRAFAGGANNIAFQEAISRAELLAPGMRHPTFDAKAAPKDMAATLCAFRRNTIDAALKKGEDGKDAVLAITGRPKNPDAYIKAMSCDALSVVFNGASEMIRTAGVRGGGGNNDQGTGTRYGGGNTSIQRAQDVVANINKVNRERFGIDKR